MLQSDLEEGRGAPGQNVSEGAVKAEQRVLVDLQKGFERARDRLLDPEQRQKFTDKYFNTLEALSPAIGTVARSFWRSEVTAEAMSNGANAIAWLGDKVNRWSHGYGSALANVVYNTPIFSQRDLLESYGLTEREAKEFGVSAKRPPSMEAVSKMRPEEAFIRGVKLEEGTVPIGHVPIPDEVADSPIPGIHRLLGIKARHLRFIPEVALDPIMGLTTGANIPKQKVRFASGATKKVPLTEKAMEIAAEVKAPYFRRAVPTIKERLRRQAASETPGYAYDLPVGETRKVSALRAGQRRWKPPSGIGTAEEYLQMDAHFRAAEAAEIHAQKILGRLIERGTKGLVDPSGIKWYGKSVLPAAAIKAPMTTVYNALRGPVLLDAALKSPVGKGLAAVVKTVDLALNELPRSVRREVNVPQYKAESRAIGSMLKSRGHQYVDQVTSGVSDAELERVGRYLQYRSTRPEAAEHLYQRLSPEGKDIVPVFDDIARQMYILEARSGTKYAPMESYMPSFYENSTEEMQRLAAAYAERSGYRATTVDVPARFVLRRAFRDMQEAVEFATDVTTIKRGKPVPLEIKPIWNVRDAFKRRIDEHADLMSISHYHDRLIKHIGVKEADIHHSIFRSRFPEFVEELGAPRGVSLASADLVGNALKIDDDIRPMFTPRSPAAVETGIKELNALLEKATDEEKFLFVQGAIKKVHNYDDWKFMLDNYDKYINEISPDIVARVRKQLWTDRQSYLDQFGRHFRRVPTKMRKLEGMYLPEAMIQDLEGIYKEFGKIPSEVSKAVRIWDNWMVDPFRAGVISVWPAFQFRNWYSDSFQAMTEIGLAALNPIKHEAARRAIRGDKGIFGWRLDGTIKIAGRNVPIKWIREEMRRHGVIKDPRDFYEIAGKGAASRIAMGKLNPLARFGAWRENEMRVQLYMHYRMQGIEPSVAAAEVNRIFFDYAALSRTLKGVRRVYPFATWTLKNMRLQAEQFVRRPGRQAKQLQLLGTMGPNDMFLPEYLWGDLKIGYKKLGKQFFITGIDLPISSALELTDISSADNFREAWRRWYSGIHPTLRIPADLFIYERDPFTRGELGPEAMREARGMEPVIRAMPTSWQNFLEVEQRTDKRTGEKVIWFNKAKFIILTRGIFLSRFASTGIRFGDYIKKEGVDWLAMLADWGTGLRLKEYDLSKEEEARIWTNVRYIRKKWSESHPKVLEQREFTQPVRK